jgi:23S rRNA (adenine2503-C2)-methyltransferase
MNLDTILLKEKPFRRDQIFRAWFDLNISGYDKITTLSAPLRGALQDEAWITVTEIILKESKAGNTFKALLKLADGQAIETVLMARDSLKKNKEGKRYTICVSTQVGCPMNCTFCATGAAGFCRSLEWREIVDQYRFWQKFLHDSVPGSKEKIDNIVLMGQGEPLANYENVKGALNLLLHYTEIGPSKITLSTAGIPAMMDKMIEDEDFPPVRFALSLHSAIESTRKKIMPSHKSGFLEFLPDWASRYHKHISSRAHFIGLEYTLLAGVNDDEQHLKALIKLASKLGRVRINLIPYNVAAGEFRGSSPEVIKKWHEALMAAGFTSTIRFSQGQDIEAACGQLKSRLKK